MSLRRGRRPYLLVLAILLPGWLYADNVNDGVTVAVASNFAATAAELSRAFTESSGVPVRITAGSTGKLYTQIIYGAPFDVFLAADTERPRLLEESGLIARGSRRTYATGALVLWSRDARLAGKDCRDVLERGEYDKLALANPLTAPYGSAARETLKKTGLWEDASKHAVYGESIAQTLQFVASGNATLGFIGQAQLIGTDLPAATCAWKVPASMHTALHQQAVLLRRASGNRGARQFFDFLGKEPARQIIGDRGYGVPD